MDVHSSLIKKLIALSLEEDSVAHDITSAIGIPDGHRSDAYFLSKEDFVLCGVPLLAEIISEAKMSVVLGDFAVDGTQIKNGDRFGTLRGFTKEILSLERTMLNFLQHLSGVSTLTHRYVTQSGSLTVLDTRKTTPGWRVLEKYAVTVGGGKNHRMNLSDQILIKNNHIDAFNGDLKSLFESVKKKRPPHIPLEVEVRSQGELENVLQEITPEIIMLDNMDDGAIRTAVTTIQAKDKTIAIELSGGMTIERIRALSELPVFVSIGAITTQAVNVDISLRIESKKG